MNDSVLVNQVYLILIAHILVDSSDSKYIFIRYTRQAILCVVHLCPICVRYCALIIAKDDITLQSHPNISSYEDNEKHRKA